MLQTQDDSRSPSTDTLLGVPSTLTLGRSNSFFMEILGPLSSSERLPKSSLSLLSAYGCAIHDCVVCMRGQLSLQVMSSCILLDAQDETEGTSKE
jgi:hypothetical protein